MKSKLKAFTVLEILMSIAIMAIIVSIVYFLYVSISKQVFLYVNNSSSMEETFSFYTQLKNDVYQATTIEKRKDVIRFNFYNGDKVLYRIKKDQLIRIQNEMNIRIMVGNMEVKELSSDFNAKKLVSEIKYTGKLLDKEVLFEVKKEYPSNFLIKE